MRCFTAHQPTASSVFPRILVAIILQSLCLRLILNTRLSVSVELSTSVGSGKSCCSHLPSVGSSSASSAGSHSFTVGSGRIMLVTTQRCTGCPGGPGAGLTVTKIQEPKPLTCLLPPGSTGPSGWKAGKGQKRDFSTFHGKLSSTLSDFSQERDLLSKKVLISHRCFSRWSCTVSTKPERNESIVKLMKK